MARHGIPLEALRWPQSLRRRGHPSLATWVWAWQQQREGAILMMTEQTGGGDEQQLVTWNGAFVWWLWCHQTHSQTIVWIASLVCLGGATSHWTKRHVKWNALTTNGPNEAGPGGLWATANLNRVRGCKRCAWSLVLSLVNSSAVKVPKVDEGR